MDSSGSVRAHAATVDSERRHPAYQRSTPGPFRELAVPRGRATSMTMSRNNFAPGSESVRSCQTITVFMRGSGNIARTRFSGSNRMHRSAIRPGSAATQSVSAAAIAAMMK